MKQQDYINLLGKGFFTVAQDLGEQAQNNKDYKIRVFSDIWAQYTEEMQSFFDGLFTITIVGINGLVKRIYVDYKGETVEQYSTDGHGDTSYRLDSFSIDFVMLDGTREHLIAYNPKSAFRHFVLAYTNKGVQRAIVSHVVIEKEFERAEKFSCVPYLHYDADGINDIDFSDFD